MGALHQLTEKRYIQEAREAIDSYESIGDIANVDLRELIANIIGAKATPTLCYNLSTLELKNLVNMTVQELESVGLSHIQALTFHSAMLIAKRYRQEFGKDDVTIRSPEDAADFIMEELRGLKQEHFVVLFLNTKNEVFYKTTIFIGSLNASIVHPREVFREAVKRSAASIIVAHNHPSGSPKPSQEDVHVTRRLAESGKMIGIEVLDHVVIGERKFVSLKEEGLM